MSILEELVEGLQIFKTYGGNDVAAERDAIYSGQPRGVAINKEDIERLLSIGWIHDSDCSCESAGPDPNEDGWDNTHDHSCNDWLKFV